MEFSDRRPSPNVPHSPVWGPCFPSSRTRVLSSADGAFHVCHAAIPEPRGDAEARTDIARLRDLGPWSEMEVASVLVERRSPLPDVFAEHLRQSFGIFSGPLLRDLLVPNDWARLLAVYDPTSPAYLFSREDLHVIQVLTFCRLVP